MITSQLIDELLKQGFRNLYFERRVIHGKDVFYIHSTHLKNFPDQFGFAQMAIHYNQEIEDIF